MPYFIVFRNSSGDDVIKMVKDRGRLGEAVDEAVKGQYVQDNKVTAYHANAPIFVNLDARVR